MFPDPSRSTTLVISASPDDVKALALALKGLPDARLLIAPGVAEGLESARAEEPDVILLDVAQLGMIGREVCRRLREDEELREIPVLFLTTAGTDRESRLGALEVGAAGFLTRPFDDVDLRVQIRAMARLRAAHRLHRREDGHLSALVADRTAMLEQEPVGRQRAKWALHASEVGYRRLFESAKDGILILDAETGMIVDANPFLTAMLGLSHEAILEKKVWELGFLGDRLASQDSFFELQQEGYVRYDDLPLRGSDGRPVHVEFVSRVRQQRLCG
jgi:PAS domain S-box-containing protein